MNRRTFIKTLSAVAAAPLAFLGATSGGASPIHPAYIACLLQDTPLIWHPYMNRLVIVGEKQPPKSIKWSINCVPNEFIPLHLEFKRT